MVEDAAAAGFFYGELSCMATLKSRAGVPCGNKAYYFECGLCIGGAIRLLCGVHRKAGDVELPRNPNKKANIRAKRAQERVAIEAAAEENLRAGVRGALIATKLRMMREPEDHPGFMRVFPNNRHGGRQDGYGCPALSPMRLGPVEHGQPDLPPAKLLENWWQANKVYPSEIEGSPDDDPQPTPEWYVTQRELYESDVPMRHKPTSGKKNAPLFSVWIRPSGEQYHCSYVESRQFYCHFYERLATAPGSEAAADFDNLRSCRDAGYNLQIVGYDGRPVPVLPEWTQGEADVQQQMIEGELLKMYRDASAPFGHELVLYTLLAIDDPERYPWRLEKTEEF